LVPFGHTQRYVKAVPSPLCEVEWNETTVPTAGEVGAYVNDAVGCGWVLRCTHASSRLLQISWSQYWWVLMTWLYCPKPFVPSGVPNVNKHLSAISFPLESYQPVPIGSVIVS